MKRRRGRAERASIDVADVLILLSHGKEEEEQAGITNSSPPPPLPMPRVFECKTCSRRFPSFQALGGHRASHKRPRLAGCVQAELGKPRAHECSVCGLEFAVGQALGGHMRRHRAQHGGAAAEIVRSGKKRGLWLDLNLPPAEGDGGDSRKKILGLEIMDHMDHAAPVVVDCFH